MTIAVMYLEVLRSAAALAAAFWVLELVAGGHKSSEWLRNSLYLPVSLASIVLVQVALGPPLSTLLSVLRGGVLSRLVPSPETTIEMVCYSIVFAVFWDVWQYWVHRWQHSSAVLWQIHKLHHSDSNVSSSTQARNHPLNYLYLALCYVPVVALFGAVAPHPVATVLMFRVWGFVNHANVRVSFGPLTAIIAGPQWHRIHHSVEMHHRDKNFAAYFPFIDRLFGTYYEPAREEYPATGLAPGEAEPFLVQISTAPFAAWLAMAKSALRVTRVRRVLRPTP